MEMGSVERQLAKQSMRMTKTLPDRIKNAPKLKMGLELYLDIFFELEFDRPIGMSIGPISWFIIDQYCISHNFDSYQKECAHYYIRGLDNEYLKHINKDS